MGVRRIGRRFRAAESRLGMSIFHSLCFRLRCVLWCATVILLSRFSLPYLFPQHFPSHVALCVQNDGVRSKVIQDMVVLFLDPAGMRRYSSSNLCPALSSPGRQSRRAKGGGTLLVNRAEAWFIESRKGDIPWQEVGETPPGQPPGWRRYPRTWRQARTRRHTRTRSFRCSN